MNAADSGLLAKVGLLLNLLVEDEGKGGREEWDNMGGRSTASPIQPIRQPAVSQPAAVCASVTLFSHYEHFCLFLAAASHTLHRIHPTAFTPLPSRSPTQHGTVLTERSALTLTSARTVVTTIIPYHLSCVNHRPIIPSTLRLSSLDRR